MTGDSLSTLPQASARFSTVAVNPVTPPLTGTGATPKKQAACRQTALFMLRTCRRYIQRL
ncbi:hypothetical protein GCM10027256_01460 [Novispirillum itersonii subsp. nipponicum]